MFTRLWDVLNTYEAELVVSSSWWLKEISHAPSKPRPLSDHRYSANEESQSHHCVVETGPAGSPDLKSEAVGLCTDGRDTSQETRYLEPNFSNNVCIIVEEQRERERERERGADS